jgi:putative ABC transport system ATP-binding protein
MVPSIVETRDLAKSYAIGGVAVRAVGGVSLDIEHGEFLALMGPSGSGKSTFMNLLGCLDRQTVGIYRFEGLDVAGLGADRLAALRNRRIGFVFQSFNLLPRADALTNVELPMLYARVERSARHRRAAALLDAVGLGEQLRHTPAELSGGQQQRVAIARAMANSPALLLADEPTGALDSRTGAEIIDLFDELNHSGLTIVMVTHDEAVARRAGRIVRFKDGLIDSANGAPPVGGGTLRTPTLATTR